MIEASDDDLYRDNRLDAILRGKLNTPVWAQVDDITAERHLSLKGWFAYGAGRYHNRRLSSVVHANM